MDLSRLFGAALAGGLALLVNASSLAANPLVREINIRPIRDRHPQLGNALGLAVNADAHVMYLSHGSDSFSGAYLYTLDMNGALLAEVNWVTFYGPSSYPIGLAYEPSTGRLHALVIRNNGGSFSARVVDIDPSGPTILGEFPVSSTNHGFEQRADGYWQTLFSPSALRHYGLAGGFIEDLPIGAFGDGVASSFTGEGFFLSDHQGRRISEIDRQGNLLRVAST